MSDYFKRMVLVPEGMLNTIQQYQQQQITPETKNLVRLDNQMETILQDKTQSDDDKAREFSQYLQRYLTMYDKVKTRSLPSSLEQAAMENTENEARAEAIATEDGTTRTEQEIIDSVPVTFKSRAQNLLRKLKSHPDKISWDDHSQLVLDGTTVPGSNMVDLVNDVLRPRKNFSPKGYEAFVQGLAEINTPEDFIRNEARRKLLLEYRDNRMGRSPMARREEETPAVRSFFPTPPSSGSPSTKKRRRLPMITPRKQSPVTTSTWVQY